MGGGLNGQDPVLVLDVDKNLTSSIRNSILAIFSVEGYTKKVLLAAILKRSAQGI
jgi:hypothetical protein